MYCVLWVLVPFSARKSEPRFRVRIGWAADAAAQELPRNPYWNSHYPDVGQPKQAVKAGKANRTTRQTGKTSHRQPLQGGNGASLCGGGP